MLIRLQTVLRTMHKVIFLTSIQHQAELYSRIDSTKSPASGACNVSALKPVSQVGSVREVVCA